MKNIFSVFMMLFLLLVSPLSVEAKTKSNNEMKNIISKINNENLKTDNMSEAYWLYPSVYAEAKTYVTREVWDKGFWLVNEYIYGYSSSYVPSFQREFGLYQFDINVVFDQIYSTRCTMDYYDSFLRGYYYWDALYCEYYRLYNIIYYSLVGSWYWEFNGNYFYDIECSFLAGYSWY